MHFFVVIKLKKANEYDFLALSNNEKMLILFFSSFYLECIFVLMFEKLAGGQCYESIFMEEAI